MELLPLDEEKLKDIARRHDLRFIILHGSYARRTPLPGSDIDIAILGRRRIDFDEFLTIHGELAEIFGDSPGRDLDLKALHGVDPFFRYEVTRGGVLLCGDPADYEEFKAYAYRDYIDSADLRELERILLEKSIRSLAERYA